MDIRKKRRLISVATLLLAAIAILFTSLTLIEKADAEAEQYVLSQGTSYTASHGINEEKHLFNYAEEANGIYSYYQNCSSLPVQVHYTVKAHMVSGSQVTTNCHILLYTEYKILGFIDKKDYSDGSVSGDTLFNDPDYSINGYLNGLHYNARFSKTTFTYSDSEYGTCTWTITAR